MQHKDKIKILTILKASNLSVQNKHTAVLQSHYIYDINCYFYHLIITYFRRI